MSRTIVTKSDVEKQKLGDVFMMPPEEAVFLANYYLVQASIQKQDERKRDSSFMGSDKFLTEVCTVRAQSSRNTGHTTSLIRIASYFENPVIICPNTRHIQNISKNPRLTRGDRQYGVTYIIEPEEMEGKKFDFVGVDCSSIREKKDRTFLSTLYQKCCIMMTGLEYKIILLSG